MTSVNVDGGLIAYWAAQGKRLDRRQQDSVLQGSLGHCQKDPAAGAAAAATAGDADISSDETHPQPALKAEVADIPPAFAAPSKSGGSELFDALLMAATGRSRPDADSGAQKQDVMQLLPGSCP